MSTRERILSALAKFGPRQVELPALGETVYVRPLTVAGMARIHGVSAEPMVRHRKAEDALKANPEDPALIEAERLAAEAVQLAQERSSVLMILDCVVDDRGRPLFGPSDESVIASLPAQVAEVLLKSIDEVGALSANSTGDALGN